MGELRGCPVKKCSLLSRAASILSPGLTWHLSPQEKQKRRRGAGSSCPGETCPRKPRAGPPPRGMPEEVGCGGQLGREFSAHTGPRLRAILGPSTGQAMPCSSHGTGQSGLGMGQFPMAHGAPPARAWRSLTGLEPAGLGPLRLVPPAFTSRESERCHFLGAEDSRTNPVHPHRAVQPGLSSPTGRARPSCTPFHQCLKVGSSIF